MENKKVQGAENSKEERKDKGEVMQDRYAIQTSLTIQEMKDIKTFKVTAL